MNEKRYLRCDGAAPDRWSVCGAMTTDLGLYCKPHDRCQWGGRFGLPENAPTAAPKRTPQMWANPMIHAVRCWQCGTANDSIRADKPYLCRQCAEDPVARIRFKRATGVSAEQARKDLGL